MELTAFTLTEAAARIARRELSPVELVRANLAQIERLNPVLNCFITLTAESALKQARQAEQDIRRGNYRGPLHGIPIGIKDLFETAGVRTTAGAKHLANYIPTTDAAVVAQLQAAGAISLGKLNMHEWAMGATNLNPHYGACNNPWNPAYISGGSSGGSGAALAAGLCMGALGTDTGGSIRTPASLCGIVGLKPTYGRVSLRGVIPLSWHLDHVGPMARRVRDVAILFQIIAGYDPADPFSINIPTENYTAHLEDGVQGWRIALAVGDYVNQTAPEIRQAVHQAARVFEQLGAHVIEADLPWIREARQINPIIIASDAAAFHQARLATAADDFGVDVRTRLQQGLAYPAVVYADARRKQAELRRQADRFFDGCDLLLLPTNPVAALRRDAPDFDAQRALLPQFTAPFNLTGIPALSLPCGLTDHTLPIGLQLVGPAWREARVLQAAYAYEQATDWHAQVAPTSD
ncbi:MAG: amidase [Anaerolineae bacterium]|nr:amidase [Anaerolineae bacterium]